ncbi:MAG: ATP synthase subunit I [Rhodoferax sp.]|nr:ATP synthase subunit I [Rhodoferax sp.]
MTPAQIAAIKAANPPVSPWWVVLGQIVVGLLASILAWGFFGEAIAKSLACGVLAVVVPAALFARGLTSRFATANVGTAVMSFFIWELVKIVLTVGLLMAAHRWVAGLSWPAMLVGLVIAIKVYWLALAFRRQPKAGASECLTAKVTD